MIWLFAHLQSNSTKILCYSTQHQHGQGCTSLIVIATFLCKNYHYDNFPSFLGNIRFLLRGKSYHNNSFVFLEDIGDSDDALLCITNQTACCRRPHTGEEESAMGNWFFPNGTRVSSYTVNETSGLQLNVYTTRGEMVVRMHRRRDGEDGIYRCEIPDAMNVTQTIYIGVYTRSECHSYMYILDLCHTAVLWNSCVPKALFSFYFTGQNFNIWSYN